MSRTQARRGGPRSTTTTTNVECRNCGTANRLPAAADGTPRCANRHQWLPWIAAGGSVGDVVRTWLDQALSGPPPQS